MGFLRGFFTSVFGSLLRDDRRQAILGTEIPYFVLGFTLVGLALDLKVSTHFHPFTSDCARDISVSQVIIIYDT